MQHNAPIRLCCVPGEARQNVFKKPKLKFSLFHGQGYGVFAHIVRRHAGKRAQNADLVHVLLREERKWQ